MVILAPVINDQKKPYYDLWSYYSEDLKQFQRREDQIKEARTKIMARVSKEKALLLDPDQSLREWLFRLKKDTTPSKDDSK